MKGLFFISSCFKSFYFQLLVHFFWTYTSLNWTLWVLLYPAVEWQTAEFNWQSSELTQRQTKHRHCVSDNTCRETPEHFTIKCTFHLYVSCKTVGTSDQIALHHWRSNNHWGSLIYLFILRGGGAKYMWQLQIFYFYFLSIFLLIFDSKLWMFRNTNTTIQTFIVKVLVVEKLERAWKL